MSISFENYSHNREAKETCRRWNGHSVEEAVFTFHPFSKVFVHVHFLCVVVKLGVPIVIDGVSMHLWYIDNSFPSTCGDSSS